MTYVTTKYIKGNPYLYLVRSEREGEKVRQVFVRYLGREGRYTQEELDSIAASYEREYEPREAVVTRPEPTPEVAPAEATPTKEEPPFKTTTDIPILDSFLKDPKYAESKDYQVQVTTMSPNEYFERTAEMQGTNVERQRQMVGQELLDKYIDMMQTGTKFDMPHLDYKLGEQEGRARVLAAKQLGYEYIPVLIADDLEEPKFISKPTPKTPVRRGKRRAEVWSETREEKPVEFITKEEFTKTYPYRDTTLEGELQTIKESGEFGIEKGVITREQLDDKIKEFEKVIDTTYEAVQKEESPPPAEEEKPEEIVLSAPTSNTYADIEMKISRYESGEKMRKMGVLQSSSPKPTPDEIEFAEIVRENIYKGNTAMDRLAKDYNVVIGKGKKQRIMRTSDDFREANPQHKDMTDQQVQELVNSYMAETDKIISDKWANPPKEVMNAYKKISSERTPREEILSEPAPTPEEPERVEGTKTTIEPKPNGLRCSNCGRPIKRPYYFEGKPYGIECWKDIALPEIERRREEKFKDTERERYIKSALDIEVLKLKDPSKITSDFKRQFIPSVISQFEEKGFISNKQRDIITDMWNQKDWKNYWRLAVEAGIQDKDNLIQVGHMTEEDFTESPPAPPEEPEPITLTLYHGSRVGRTDAGDFGKGRYLTGDYERARAYGEVSQETITLRNPKVFNTYSEAMDYRKSIVGEELVYKPQSEEASQMMEKVLKDEGYDGVIVYDKEAKYTAYPDKPFEVVKFKE